MTGRLAIERLLQVLMFLNAAIFFFAAIEHTGVSIGPFREPTIIPPAVPASI